MSEMQGVICAHLLDGRGGGRELTWPEVLDWQPENGTLWVHLDRTGPTAQHWLADEAGLDPLACEALLAEETRPRSTLIGEGLLVILRGVNLDPGADPEDMVSIRMWIEANRIVTLRQRRLMAAQDTREALNQGRGPRDAGDFLVEIATRLIERMEPVLEDLDDAVDSIEDEILQTPNYQLRTRLSTLRRQAIGLRRHIAPQREVLSRLQVEPVPWFDNLHRARLREVADRVTRYVEDLDAARERAAVTQEELAGRLAEQMNRTMYTLSLVAAIFLPLGLITGLLGINVGGIPGAEVKWAFSAVCGLLVVLAALQMWLFHKKRWL
ncbi:zinc transporter ZntB [Candidatus Sumerlaeota bacterium]|nr:zinc transporter ZntB [Candidatus Sumerlaeota bacterium]